MKPTSKPTSKATSKLDLYADYLRHGRSLTDPGLWALTVRRFGNWAADLPNPTLRRVGSKLYGGALFFVQATTGNLINREIKFGDEPDLRGSRNMIIHAHVEIGDRCRIASSVSVGTNERFKRGLAKIGNDVIIEDGVKILGPVTIGDRAIIRANSLVLTDVPAGAIAMGVPAKCTRPAVEAPRLPHE
jgi:serine O-acetyltransferase